MGNNEYPAKGTRANPTPRVTPAVTPRVTPQVTPAGQSGELKSGEPKGFDPETD